MDNPLSNALRASPPGSTVTIELRMPAPPRRALRDHRPRWVDLHVTDEGPGMTEEQRARAFVDRFWRAPGAPKGGTGPGLALVQRLAHASGGEATLHAAAGGLDVVIRLPSARPPGEGNGPGGDRPRRPRREAPALPA